MTECEHETLRAENERFAPNCSYRDHIFLEYDLICNQCEKKVDTERVRYRIDE